jgi:malate dehydrogenase (oxaloacetate-decarboxylating)(NADP+)
LPNLAAAIKKLRPSILIGASGKPDAFSRPILESMAYYNRRPVVFALSNPASKSECTAAQAYIWTQGRAIFASGSPVCPVIVRGRTFVPSQANNVYIFPGIGLGAMVSGARRINNAMLLVAARTLSCEVSDADLAKGCVYPRLENIRDISAAIAAAVATIAYVQGLGDISVPADDLKAVIKHQMYKPRYPSYA